MQHIYRTGGTFFSRTAGPLLLLVGAGCGERATTIDPPPDSPHAGLALTVAVADPADRDLARQLARSWAARNGAIVRVLDAPFDGTPDLAIIPPADLPRWAAANTLLEAPAARRDPSDPYRWDDLLPAERDKLLTWGGRTYGLPVLGEGMVLVYRKSAFDGKGDRPPGPPATWDDLANDAARLGPGSLPPLPADSERLQAEFFTAAAGYDRPAFGRNAGAEVLKQREAFFTFQFDMTTGAPRLDAPAFVHVADLFKRMQPFRGPGTDPAEAFRTGKAKLGILTLTELGRVGPDAATGLGIAPLPGAGFTFGPNGEHVAPEGGPVNRVPYFGWGGRVGVVSARCTSPQAAWDLLAEAGLPDRGAIDLLADPRWGAGPYRTSQLDARARGRWYAYGLSAAETEQLTTSLRDNLGLAVQNYRLRLRTPNHAELDKSLDEQLRTLLTTPTADPRMAMEAANAKWKAATQSQPGWVETVRKSLGI
jgi:multiple sugar transport system substrate-binding protein